MNEDILAGFLCNEPEAFRVIPPFDSSTRHSTSLLNAEERNPKNYGQKTAKAGQVSSEFGTAYASNQDENRAKTPERQVFVSGVRELLDLESLLQTLWQMVEQGGITYNQGCACGLGLDLDFGSRPLAVERDHRQMFSLGVAS